MSKDQASRSEGAPLVVSFGEMLIDFVPDVAGVSLAESGGFLKAPGGAPANVAVAITKLGGCSAFVGKVNVRPRPPPPPQNIWPGSIPPTSVRLPLSCSRRMRSPAVRIRDLLPQLVTRHVGRSLSLRSGKAR